jgi:2-keto-3-deoxy-L-rhamnonate aldolase RhmA
MERNRAKSSEIERNRAKSGEIRPLVQDPRMPPPLKVSLRDRRLLRVLGLGQLCHPKLIEQVALLGGYDAVWLDQEHVGLTIPQIEDACRAARAGGIDVFVRLNATDYASVMRVLEAGSSGMMISMVRSVDQVRDLVRWAKFHPAGERGVNGSGIDGRFGATPFAEYLRASNERTLLGVQIEHIDAVEAIDDILAVPEIDFLFFGPADLSQSMGIPGAWDDPRLWGAMERVMGACAKAGRPWGTLAFSLPFARRCVEKGCRILGVGLDVWVVKKGIEAYKQEFAEFFGM